MTNNQSKEKDELTKGDMRASDPDRPNYNWPVLVQLSPPGSYCRCMDHETGAQVGLHSSYAHHLLANCNLTYLDHSASCFPSDLAMNDHSDLLRDFLSQYSELLVALGHQKEVVTSQEPDVTEIPSSCTLDFSVPTEGFSAAADRFMACQMRVG